MYRVTSTNPPGVMFAEFFGETYLPAMYQNNSNTFSPTLCEGKHKL